MRIVDLFRESFPMTDGTVTFFDRHSGGGFIPSLDERDSSRLGSPRPRAAGLETLVAGQKVSFDHHSGPYGTATATNIITRS